MRNIFMRLTKAMAAVSFLYWTAMFLYDHDHFRSHCEGDAVLAITSPFVVFAVFQLGEWILTGRLPFSKRVTSSEPSAPRSTRA